MANGNRNTTPTQEFVNISIDRYDAMVTELLAYRSAIKFRKTWLDDVQVEIDLTVPFLREYVEAKFKEDYDAEFEMSSADEWSPATMHIGKKRPVGTTTHEMLEASAKDNQ